MTEEINCKKTPIDKDGLLELLQDLETVFVTKGKKFLEFPAGKVEDIASVAIGRSGNLRAPSLRQGKVLVVGFNEESTQKLASLAK